MFCIQAFDYEEGSAARWFDLQDTNRETRDEVRTLLKDRRRSDPDDCMYSYRIVEVGSGEYYSQPTDKLEY